MGNRSARWPYAVCAAVVLYLAAGVTSAKCPTWDDCARMERLCERHHGNWMPCRRAVRECYRRWEICTGGVR